MKRLFKVLSVLCLVVCMMVTSMVPVYASTRASDLIESYDVYIDNIGGGELEIVAILSTLPDCEKLEILYVDLYEKDENGDWAYMDGWSASVRNDNLLALTECYNGEIGKEYMAEAYFRATDGDIVESRTLTSVTVVCR